MRRTLLLTAAAALAVGLAAAPAHAAEVTAPQLVGIAAADGRTFATATTRDPAVLMVPRDGTAYQRWSVVLTTPTVGTRVVNAGTRGCLGISPVTPGPVGAPVVQLPCRNDTLELWRIERSGTDTTVRFVHVRTGLCMTTGITPTPPARLSLQRCANLLDQTYLLVNGV
ncbi:MAG TPA: RICIN domain-containing protein [Pseudonocardiaceae bacterium]